MISSARHVCRRLLLPTLIACVGTQLHGFSATELSCAVIAQRAKNLTRNENLTYTQALSQSVKDLTFECDAIMGACGEDLLRPSQVMPLGALPYGMFANGMTGTLRKASSNGTLTGCLYFETGSLRSDVSQDSGDAPLEWLNLLQPSSTLAIKADETALRAIELEQPRAEDTRYFIKNLFGTYPAKHLYQEDLGKGRIALRQGMAPSLDAELGLVSLTHSKDVSVTAIRLIQRTLTGRNTRWFERALQIQHPSISNAAVSLFDTFNLEQITSVDAFELRLQHGSNAVKNKPIERFGTLRFFDSDIEMSPDTTVREYYADKEDTSGFWAVLENLDVSNMELTSPKTRRSTLRSQTDTPNTLHIRPNDFLNTAKFPRFVALVSFQSNRDQTVFETFEVNYK